MYISNYKTVDLEPGKYKAIICNISQETSRKNRNLSYYVYDLVVFNDNEAEICEERIYVFENSFFVDKLIQNYLHRKKGKIELNQHIGTVVQVALSITHSQSGDEYLRLNSYRPWRAEYETELEATDADVIEDDSIATFKQMRLTDLIPNNGPGADSDADLEL